jgi:hypothetical protein
MILCFFVNFCGPSRISFPDVYVAGSTNLCKRLTEQPFLWTNTWFCVHKAHAYLEMCKTKNSRRLDDSAEFQTVPAISKIYILVIVQLQSAFFSAQIWLWSYVYICIFQSSKIANLQIRILWMVPAVSEVCGASGINRDWSKQCSVSPTQPPSLVFIWSWMKTQKPLSRHLRSIVESLNIKTWKRLN